MSSADDQLVVSNQAGGISKDTWVLATEPEKHISLLADRRDLRLAPDKGGEVPGRVADNMFWVGRYAERAEFNSRFNDMGFWAVLTAGVTPFPYKVITIMSGWTGMPLATFVATSILARGIRFFLVALLLWKYGAPVRTFIEQRLGLMFTLFVMLLAGGFYAVRFL